jgi:hypothetical protein
MSVFESPSVISLYDVAMFRVATGDPLHVDPGEKTPRHLE